MNKSDNLFTSVPLIQFQHLCDIGLSFRSYLCKDKENSTFFYLHYFKPHCLFFDQCLKIFFIKLIFIMYRPPSFIGNFYTVIFFRLSRKLFIPHHVTEDNTASSIYTKSQYLHRHEWCPPHPHTPQNTHHHITT